MKPFQVNIEGTELRGQVMKVGSVLWVHINGRTISYEPEGGRSSKKSQQVVDPHKIVAPMPGKIIRVLAQPGDAVQIDQTLVVLEAMKMEYSLKAAIAGQIKVVSCKAGAQVTAGDLLIEIKED